MKKIIALISAAILCLSCLASCGSSTKDLMEYTLADTQQYITLGNYKGVSVSQSEIDKQLAAQIENVLNASKYEADKEGAAEEGDKLTFSCTGTIDGTAYDALTMKEKTVTVGSKITVIKEMEEAFVGMSAGDTKEIAAKIPDSFCSDDNVNGKDAVLSVTINKVTETVTPTELTDEMVSTYTKDIYKTVDSYKEYVANAIKENLAWDAALESCTFNGYPEDLAETYYNNYLSSYTSSASSYGISLEQLISAYGMTSENFYGSLAKQAISQTQNDLALCAISLNENIQPSEDEIKKTVDALMQDYEIASEEELYKAIEKDRVVQTTKHRMAIEFIAENAVVTE